MRSPELTARADSLDRLDVAAEVENAVRRGDYQYVGICGYACFPPGDHLYPQSGLRIVEGTTDGVFNKDGQRLNEAAYRYARAYNQLMSLRVARRAPGGRGPS